MNILITSAGRRVSLVKYFQIETKRLVGQNSSVFTTDLNPPISTACLKSDGSFQVKSFSAPDFIDDIYSICAQNHIKIIIPTIDTGLKLFSEHRASFLEKGVHIIVSDSHFIKICRDKRLMNSFFIQRGFKVPLEIDRRKPKFPLFIKPIDGSSSNNIFLIENKSMLAPFHFEREDFMIMEYLDPERYQEYTIDLYYNKNGILKCAVPRIRLNVRAGETNKGITQKNHLVDIIRSRLNYIEGARGCLTLQVFDDLDTEDVYGIEINPRFGGGYPLSYLAGANYPAWIIEEYLSGGNISNFNDWEDNMLLLRHDAEVIVPNFLMN